jgi:transposase
MPAERVCMRRVREILRLKFAANVAVREIARRVGTAPSTVRATLNRFQAATLTWPLPDQVSDSELEAALYRNAGTKQDHRRHAEPDWAMIHRELKRKHVTLSILWEEYVAQHPDGYRYSRFCELYRAWEGKLSVTMRQTHLGGDKLFVDYAGDTVPVVIDRLTGEARDAQIFVAVLGASSFTYAEATWTQTLADWIGAHTHALAAIGGTPKLFVPDNTKVAVIKASLYDPQVNRTYTEMASHYEVAILPARPRKPRDKAKVEACVLIIERWLLGRLRNRRFYGLAELNQAIQALLVDLNERRPAARGHTPPLAGGTRSSGAEAAPRRTIRLRRMARPPRRARLSPGHRWSLLQRALPLRPRAGRGALDRPHRRGVPQGRTHRRASAQLRQRPPYHRAGPYAFQPPALCRLDHRAHPPRGGRHRALDRAALRTDPRASPASRAGLSRLPGHRATGQALRARAGGGRRRPRARHRRALLRIAQVHP